MARPQLTECPSRHVAVPALVQQFANHGNKTGVGPHRCRPAKRQTCCTGPRGRLHIEIVNDLHVVTDKTNRYHHNRGHGTSGAERREMVTDVRDEPGDVRRPAAADIGEVVTVAAPGPGCDPVGDRTGRGRELPGVGVTARAAGFGLRSGNRVGDEDQPRAVRRGRRNRCQRVDHMVDHGQDKAGMVEVVPQLDQFRHAGTDRGPRVREIFAVLAATGIGGEGGRDKAGRPPDAVAAHLREGVGEKRRPVAVAPVHGQRCEFGFQRGQ